MNAHENMRETFDGEHSDSVVEVYETEEASPMALPSDGDLIAKYLELRGAMEKMAQVFKDKTAPYLKGMEAIEGLLLARLNERDAQNTKSDAGVAYKQTSMATKVVDKDAMLAFAGEHWIQWGKNLMTAHVSKDEVQRFMDQNNGSEPPGIKVEYYTKLVIRKG